MSDLFKKPEEPTQVTKWEIIRMLGLGQPLFCGLCKEQISIRRSSNTNKKVVRCLKCSTWDEKEAVGVFRMEQGVIFLDAIYIPKNQFDLSKHLKNHNDYS